MEKIPLLVKGISTFSITVVPAAFTSLATTSNTFSMLKKAGLRLRYMRVRLMLREVERCGGRLSLPAEGWRG
jgi:hypothetical protein